MYQNRQICLSCTALYETHPHTALFTCSANLSLNYEVKLSDWYNKFAKKNEKDPKTRHQTRDSGWWPRKSTANFLVKSVLYYVHDNRKDLAFAKIVESDFPIRHLNVRREIIFRISKLCIRMLLTESRAREDSVSNGTITKGEQDGHCKEEIV